MDKSKMKLWAVSFEVTVEGVAKPIHQHVHAVGTDDLNSLVEFIKATVLATPVEVEVPNPESQPNDVMSFNLGGGPQPPFVKEARRAIGFNLCDISDVRYDIQFLDVGALAAAGILTMGHDDEAHA